MRLRWVLAVGVGLCVQLGVGARDAAAGTLTLSDFSSDSTPASALDATFEFTVVGTELTFTVTNNTPDPGGYNINLAAFNASPKVGGLSLDSVDGVDCIVGDGSDCGWTLDTDQGVDGMGAFDFVVEDGVGIDPNQIAPGDDRVFLFTIAGTNPFSASNFGTELSTNPSGGVAALGAAKFVSGPGDDSAFGAVVPEPGTLALVGLGLAGLAITSRRRA